MCVFRALVDHLLDVCACVCVCVCVCETPFSDEGLIEYITVHNLFYKKPLFAFTPASVPVFLYVCSQWERRNGEVGMNRSKIYAKKN